MTEKNSNSKKKKKKAIEFRARGTRGRKEAALGLPGEETPLKIPWGGGKGQSLLAIVQKAHPRGRRHNQGKKEVKKEKTGKGREARGRGQSDLKSGPRLRLLETRQR